MKLIVFAGTILKNWQTPKKTLTRNSKETNLLSGEIHVSRGTKINQFPKTFQCYADTDDEMGTIEELINYDYSTLVVDGVSYPDCYIYQISDIWELNEGYGKWLYSIEFRQADEH